MDRIFLSEMKIETTVGIWEWEKRIKQQVIIDIEMSADIKKAAATDQIEDTLNYKAVAKSVRKLVEESSFQLVETMAEKISELVIGEHNVSWVRVKVNKPGAIRGSKGVGIIIERDDKS
ncbi:MAG: dihydroneopterin aldolase [Gammaproteobacteria bacterium]|nr:MAG: dihydroneopterin aldolase [Gammaproteobacteria bacterium]|tara:strand:+ start:419 stop:775 length:357 start_codon:yes stop_codon:yes gene_type:complete